MKQVVQKRMHVTALKNFQWDESGGEDSGSDDSDPEQAWAEVCFCVLKQI